MNDTILFFTGVSVFTLMFVAMILTVLEFRQIDRQSDKSKSRKTKRFEDRD